jgi:transposase
MTQEGGYGVLTDAQWAKLAPLIEAWRPHHKTECLNLRRTIEAIVWPHTNGAKWRRCSDQECGPAVALLSCGGQN